MAPELILLTIILIALTPYAVFGGADFGAGIWEFKTALHSTETEKEQKLIFGAIGPVWEANHVWLIFVLVMLFGAFPTAFSGLCRALWFPLLLALLGIVFRGAGFAFDSSGARATHQQAAWRSVFAVASIATPFFLGASVGAIASGRLSVTAQGEFTGDYFSDWICPLSLFTAFFAVANCTYLAAVYLTRDARRSGDAMLTNLWRRRALSNGVWLGVLAVAGLILMAIDTPALWEAFRIRVWPIAMASMVAGLFSLWALWTRHFTAAVIGAPTTVAALVWAWGIAQFPAIVPPAITVESAKSPDGVLWAMIATIVAGSILVMPSLSVLLYLFKGRRPESDHSEARFPT